MNLSKIGTYLVLMYSDGEKPGFFQSPGFGLNPGFEINYPGFFGLCGSYCLRNQPVYMLTYYNIYATPFQEKIKCQKIVRNFFLLPHVCNRSSNGYLSQKIKINVGFFPKPQISSLGKIFLEIGLKYKPIHKGR